MATAHLLRKLGHEVLGFDIIPKPFPYGELVEKPKSSDVIFICTGERVVEDVIRDLVYNNVPGLYVIRSTTPPNMTKKLMKKYGIHICHNPEFLREAHAHEDAENPPFVLIGACCEDHGNVLADIYTPLKRPICLTDPTTSEMVKLTLNAYLATLIKFWNEINEFCRESGLDTKVVADMCRLDPRVSSYGTAFFGKAFEGKCLSKDLDQLIQSYRELGLEQNIFESIRQFNEKLKQRK
jgi:nucleotide sugar dehydrogenase